MKALIFSFLLFFSTTMTSAQTQFSPHRHKQSFKAPEEWKAEIKVVPAAAPDKKLKKENNVTIQSYEAFFVYQGGAGYRIFFTNRRTKQTYEILGAGQLHRPFSDLNWKNSKTLVFDSWSNPHHGAHYEFDVKNKNVARILIFED